MIRSFRHKGLAELWESGRSGKLDQKLLPRIRRRLQALDIAVAPEGLNVPGFNFHSLRGAPPVRYTIHVNGPWCITFSFDDKDAIDVDFEQYH
ncbi:type II toxin-antitoxin system RelE/ParE family toxin [Devosia sp. XJ19-1]|uniref:Type II toxin-antitoxin system RelE/ParE family toxin n=1 Tax=Devosia ureilytica TaxID=2952754 RepID=A0A9Q4FSG3_9HYPH|nr:type II toxin-antitoxin system RelE/ParE family toxin [Devosia ureilytica]MCP8884943.1 type II toxin-antitoxin system RelE/ParE family toxin [Devosia ureilytica]MCP8888546.1 type II toxin-antitoxin system RelE/ParE family toxin [Devosia ureilytica]